MPASMMARTWLVSKFVPPMSRTLPFARKSSSQRSASSQRGSA